VRWGFKSKAERRAVELRSELGLRAEAPLAARRLAKHLKVAVIGPAEIPGMTPALLDRPLVVDPSSWSARTISCHGRRVIIHNTAHSPCRQESDVMHELAHLLCEHQPSELIRLDGFPCPLRKFHAEHEDEAAWLGGCLQLPRPALWWAVRAGMTEMQIVEHFTASDDMVRYRRGKTGIDRQLAHMRSGQLLRGGIRRG
jgi:uncharacterized protein DUF955